MIIGEKVNIRAVERDDLPRYVRWLNDPEVRENLAMFYPMSLAEEEKWFEDKILKRDENNKTFAIETKDGVHIGGTGLDSINWKDRNAEFGIFIGEKDYWNKGYGTDATKTIVKFAFEEMNLARVYLRVYDDNPRAIRVYEKAGFEREGVLKKHIFRKGRYSDVIIMGILNPSIKF